MQTDFLQTANILFRDRLVGHLLENGIHDVLTHTLLVGLLDNDVFESFERDLARLFGGPELPVTLDQTSKLDGCGVVQVDRHVELTEL